MPATTTRGRGGTGRIRPDQRDTDDGVPIIGAEFELPADHQEMYEETLKHDMKDTCRRNYRNRQKKIMNFWKENNPDMYEAGVVEVSETDQKDKSKHFFDGKFKQDLEYTGLNVDFVIYFLSKSKTKGSAGIYKSWGDLRKYKDAIIWGSKMANKPLPISFYRGIEKYLAGYKKEFIVNKGKGNTDDNTSDPIPWTLYVLLLQWALDNNNIFVWFWTLAQWNCMARGASIDPLRFSNFTLGVDSIIVKYDDSKADKNAERLAEKNIYANPDDWRLCFWTGLCIWISLRGEDKFNNNNKLFLDKNVKAGTAAGNYSEQLVSLLHPHLEEVANHMDAKRFTQYSNRKGSATHACSGTTVPPSSTSIARRGEWSIGVVLDCYWHFAAVGDHYLGRILAGFDPNSSSFDTLPPHWTIPNPMNHTDIKSGMEMMFGRVLLLQPRSIPLLVRTFACFVFHSGSLRQHMLRTPGHDFNLITILQTTNKDLLARLKLLVTVDPTEGVMTVRTGIPPHVNQNRDIQELLGIVKEVKSNQENQLVEIKACIHDAFEDRALENGHPTNASLQALLNDYEKKQESKLDIQFDRLVERLGGGTNVSNGTTIPASLPQQQEGCDDSLFSYNGHFYYVPFDFVFPVSATLKTGLEFWFFGMDTANGKRVRPFRNLKPSFISTTKLKSKWNLNWKSIFGYLEKYVEFDSTTITRGNLNTYYNACVTVLKERVSFCFKKGDGKCLSWRVSTWSKCVQASHILKNGTDRDKQLVTTTLRNNSGQQHKRKRIPAENVVHRRRQQRRLDNSANHHNDTTTATSSTTTTTTNNNNITVATTTTTNNNNNNNNTTRHTSTTNSRNDATNDTTGNNANADDDNETDDTIPFAPADNDDDDDYDKHNRVLNNTQQIMQGFFQEEVNEFYAWQRSNIHEQGTLSAKTESDLVRGSSEWRKNRRDERTVKKLEEKRVEKEKYMIDKYGRDVILRRFSIADTRNDTGNNNFSTTTTTGNNNNDNDPTQNAATPAERNKNRHMFTSANHRQGIAELAEEVRVREREQNNNQIRTTTTTTVLCCAGIRCGMNNSPLDLSKDFHKCNTCGHSLHGILCCDATTFDEFAGTGKCKQCALPS